MRYDSVENLNDFLRKDGKGDKISDVHLIDQGTQMTKRKDYYEPKSYHPLKFTVFNSGESKKQSLSNKHWLPPLKHQLEKPIVQFHVSPHRQGLNTSRATEDLLNEAYLGNYQTRTSRDSRRICNDEILPSKSPGIDKTIIINHQSPLVPQNKSNILDKFLVKASTSSQIPNTQPMLRSCLRNSSRSRSDSQRKVSGIPPLDNRQSQIFVNLKSSNIQNSNTRRVESRLQEPVTPTHKEDHMSPNTKR